MKGGLGEQLTAAVASLPVAEARRLACLALAVESRTGGDGPEVLIDRARAYDQFVRGNPFTEIEPAGPAG